MAKTYINKNTSVNLIKSISFSPTEIEIFNVYIAESYGWYSDVKTSLWTNEVCNIIYRAFSVYLFGITLFSVTTFDLCNHKISQVFGY